MTVLGIQHHRPHPGKHVAPWSVETAEREAAARAAAPQPGAPSSVVISHIEASHWLGTEGRHAADPVLSRTRNLVGFRSITSSLIEVAR